VHTTQLVDFYINLNPSSLSGCDPSLEQWAAISSAVRQKNHVILFDNAYQGYATGDAERDATVIRNFAENGHNVVVCTSYSKVDFLFVRSITSFF
jgi:aspartate aminotransferase